MFHSLLLAATLSGCVTGGPPPAVPLSAPSTAQAASSPEALSPVLDTTPEHVRIPDVAEAVVQSVVNISTTRRVTMPRHPFFEFGLPGAPAPQQRRSSSLGSGVALPDGLVVTNHHVVDGAEEVKVALHDGREFVAELVGSDPKSDLALLRLDPVPDDLPTLAWGDSRALRLGETVLAVGNPFGIGHSVTRGIVSATGRAEVGIVDYEDFIQTDASINPGNSGGALVDLNGRLVGINTAILSRSGGSQGIGLAIPAHIARRVVADLADDGAVRRGWLGVSIQDIDPGLAAALALPDTRGVLIGDVSPGSPAEAAGLQAGDVVRRLDGAEVATPMAFRNEIALGRPEQAFTLEVWRNGRDVTLRGALGVHPDDPDAAAASDRPRAAPREALGLSLREADGGLEVVSVQPSSPAARAGLRPGDLLLEVDRQPATAKRLERAVDSGRVLLRVRSGQHVRYVAVDLGGDR